MDNILSDSDFRIQTTEKRKKNRQFKGYGKTKMRSTLFLRKRTTKLYENNKAEIGKKKKKLTNSYHFEVGSSEIKRIYLFTKTMT